MRMHWFVLAAVVSVAIGNASQALDSIKTVKGTLPGRVVGMSSVKVDLEQGISGSIPREVPVNQIQAIFYEDEPSELKTAKNHVLRGHFSEALTVLEQVKGEDVEQIREEVKKQQIQQDIEFYKALCTARMAMGGSGKIGDAGRLMKTFADANGKSYHYFEASEIVGDLLVAVRQYTQAAEYYRRLEKAPWPDYQMRAGVAAGRALLIQGKVEEATNSFDKVIANEASDDLAKEQRTLAKLGKAGALAASKKSDEAIKIVEGILKTADPENVSLMARAYNVLGTAHRQAGRTKEALLAFLHVEVLYPTVPDAHAEALVNLADLWEQVHKTERANRARKTLEEEYKDSPRAKQ